VEIFEAENFKSDKKILEDFIKLINDPINWNKVIHFDIEVDTNGTFPTPERNTIIQIGYEVSDLPDDVKIPQGGIQILHGYFVMGFDLPYIISRLKTNNIDPTQLVVIKDPTQDFNIDPDVKEVVYLMGRRQEIPKIRLGQRLIFDSFIQGSAKDQRLFNLKDRKLKTVAKHLNPSGEYWDLDRNQYMKMRNMLGSEKLKSYLRNDIDASVVLFNTYFRNWITVGNMLDIPVEKYIYMSSSYPANKLCRTIWENLGEDIYTFKETNIDKYGPDIAHNIRAALTDTMKPGYYLDPIYHSDFASMYPNIVMTFNISIETTRFVRFEPYTDKFSSEYIKGDDVLRLHIPDERCYKTWVIDIDQKVEGGIPKYFRALYKIRVDLKAKKAKLDENSAEYQKLHAQEGGIKIILNAITGYMGMQWAKYADLCQYVSIVGIGREIIKWVMGGLESIEQGVSTSLYNEFFNNIYKEYIVKKDILRYNLFKTVIAVDTDGFYTTSKFPNTIIQCLINKFIDQFQLLNENTMTMKTDKYDGAYFRDTKGKNYILWQGGNKFKYKGVSIRASKLPSMYDNFRDSAIIFRFKQDNEKLRELYYNYKRFYVAMGIMDLAMRIRVKSPDQYKSKNCQSMQIIGQVKETYGIQPTDGEQYEFVMSKGKAPKLIHPDDKLIFRATGPVVERNEKTIYEIDTKYYASIIDGAVKRLDLKDVIHGKQKSIFDY